MIFFRVDSSYKIGTGHVMRCLSLAEEFKRRGQTATFICRDLDGHVSDKISQRGFSVILLPRPVISGLPGKRLSPDSEYAEWLGVEQMQDAHETLKAIQDFLNETQSQSNVQEEAQSKITVVVDHYALDEQWEMVLATSSVRAEVSNGHDFYMKIMAIDDLRRTHSVDYLLDQTLRVNAEQYPRSKVRGYSFMGADYALLRRSFHQQRLQLESRESIEHRLLITLGGIDPDNIMQQVIFCLDKKRNELEHISSIDILAPKSLKHYDTLVNAVNELNNKKFKLVPFVEDMANFLSQYTLCIGAPGSSSWERCCLGVPSILIPIADNQKHIADVFEREQLAVVLSLSKLELLVNKLQYVMQNWTGFFERCIGVCDGLGVNRVANILMSNRDLHLRKAVNSDAQILYEWQQSETTRKYARNTALPTYESHCRWYERKLADVDCYFYIVVFEGTSAGTVRLDKVKDENKTSFEVSIHLSPSFMGKGIAKSALLALAQLHYDMIIHAHVLKENTASQRLFEKAGYQRIDSENFILDLF